MKEMRIKQISEFSTEVKGDVIALGWPFNMKELYQFHGSDTGPEVAESQRMEGEESNNVDNSESVNLSDCVHDLSFGRHKKPQWIMIVKINVRLQKQS
jgi:hypothetical protein